MFESIDWSQIVYTVVLVLLPALLRLIPSGEKWAELFEKIVPLVKKALESKEKKDNNAKSEHKSDSKNEKKP